MNHRKKTEHFNLGSELKKGFNKTIADPIKKGTGEVKKGLDKGVGEIKKAEEATLGGILKAINEIIAFINELKKFFKRFGGIFEQIGTAFEQFFGNFGEFFKLFFVNFGSYMWNFFKGMIDFFANWKNTVKYLSKPLNAIMMAITVFVPIFGQLIARFVLLNGSMDKIWLMWFAVFPFSVIPAVSMITGYIEPLKGGSPWDNMVWIPLIGTFIGSFISQNNKIFNILKVMLGVGSFCLAYWYKGKGQCSKENGAPLSKIALDSLISYMIIVILTVSLPFLPYIGNLFNIVTMLIPYGDLCLQAFAVFIVYVGTNVVNGTLTKEICKEEVSESSLAGLLLATIIITFIVSFAPNSIVSMLNNIKMKIQ